MTTHIFGHYDIRGAAPRGAGVMRNGAAPMVAAAITGLRVRIKRLIRP